MSRDSVSSLAINAVSLRKDWIEFKKSLKLCVDFLWLFQWISGRHFYQCLGIASAMLYQSSQAHTKYCWESSERLRKSHHLSCVWGLCCNLVHEKMKPRCMRYMWCFNTSHRSYILRIFCILVGPTTHFYLRLYDAYNTAQKFWVSNTFF